MGLIIDVRRDWGGERWEYVRKRMGSTPHAIQGAGEIERWIKPEGPPVWAALGIG
jgi:hypothetical protein